MQIRRHIGLVGFVLISAAAAAQETSWSANGRDVQGTRYSPAAEITRDNVARLEVAWTYRTGETDPRFATRKPASLEATPLVVDGVMYVGTPLGRVIALDAATGQERWVFDPMIARDVTYGDFASRGVSTWLDRSAPPNAPCRRRIYVATAQSQLFGLDARDGRPCAGFGADGLVDLKKKLRVAPFEPQAYSMTSPPAIVNDVIVTGSSIADNSRPNPASGEVRGYDARTGALKWTWDPIPQDPKEPKYGEWRGAMAHKSGGANAWSVIAGDPDRDLVFVPTGSAAPDYYGALRLGDNRYANSIVALKASTGEVVWSFQTVHHDLWDYDNASPPALATITQNGRPVPAVLQATKTGMLFVLDRETGRPIFPVEERPVPASDIPGEEASRTQPFTTLTPPLSPHRFTVDQVWGVSEADREACRAAIASLRNEGIFTPPSTQGTLVLPSNIGGAHWGGVAVDPVRQIAVVPVNRIASTVQLMPREGFDLQKARADSPRLGDDYEYNMMQGTPYVMRRRLLLSPSRFPCTPPPFGALVAIDLKTGRRLWDVPLGAFMLPSPLRQGFGGQAGGTYHERAAWGSPNLGGPIVTAGGLVFIGAALDRSLHAYDIQTGRELWRGELPASAKATPMSYRLASGEQFVAVTAGGGGAWGTGDHVVAFRIGKGQVAAQPAARWYKGNLHSHSINSDGDSPPYEVVTWYKGHGYHFLTITDHNTFTDPAAFDTNPNDNFLLIGAEEITNALTVHVNAIGITRVIPQQKGSTATEILQASIDAVRAQGGLPLINHPNFLWAFTAAEMRPLKSAALLEIASGHPLVNHAGDGRTPSTEQMWDELLTSGMRIHGVAVDDSHNFRQEFTRERANPGLAWVSVRAASLTRDSIIDALGRGDFYASTGVVLRDVRSAPGSLEVEIETRGSATIEQSRYRTVFVGRGGRELGVSHDNPARYTFKGDEGYVRARVEASSGLRAWTQAVFLGSDLEISVFSRSDPQPARPDSRAGAGVRSRKN